MQRNVMQVIIPNLLQYKIQHVIATTPLNRTEFSASGTLRVISIPCGTMLCFYQSYNLHYVAHTVVMAQQISRISIYFPRHFASGITDNLRLLLNSEWHEIRLAALLLMTDTAKRLAKEGDRDGLQELVALYDRRLDSWDPGTSMDGHHGPEQGRAWMGKALLGLLQMFA